MAEENLFDILDTPTLDVIENNLHATVTNSTTTNPSSPWTGNGGSGGSSSRRPGRLSLSHRRAETASRRVAATALAGLASASRGNTSSTTTTTTTSTMNGGAISMASSSNYNAGPSTSSSITFAAANAALNSSSNALAIANAALTSLGYSSPESPVYTSTPVASTSGYSLKRSAAMANVNQKSKKKKVTKRKKNDETLNSKTTIQRLLQHRKLIIERGDKAKCQLDDLDRNCNKIDDQIEKRVNIIKKCSRKVDQLKMRKLKMKTSTSKLLRVKERADTEWKEWEESVMRDIVLPLFRKNNVLADLTCPICLEIVHNPVMVSCGHIFCDTCIDGVFNNSGPQSAQEFHSCPLCRACISEFSKMPCLHLTKLLSLIHPYNYQLEENNEKRYEDSNINNDYSTTVFAPAAQDPFYCMSADEDYNDNTFNDEDDENDDNDDRNYNDDDDDNNDSDVNDSDATFIGSIASSISTVTSNSINCYEISSDED